MNLKEHFKKADELFPYEERKRIIDKIANYVEISTGVSIPPQVRKAMYDINRGYFVQPEYLKYAYHDTPLPLPCSQTISAIHMCMVLLSALDVKRDMKVLEIGTGSGYLTALLAFLVGEKGKVVSIEYYKKLYLYAMNRLNFMNIKNVVLVHGDGKKGYPSLAPYQRVICSASSPFIPPTWIEQLDKRGILVMPLKQDHREVLIRYFKDSNKYEEIMNVSFVELK